jgi:hypothetical protein
MKLTAPKAYLDYVSMGGRMESFTKGEPGYFMLWPIDELEKWNVEYQVEEFMPGFFGIGSDGGGEMLAVDSSGAVYKLPFIGYRSRADAWKIADSWDEIAARISDD